MSAHINSNPAETSERQNKLQRRIRQKAYFRRRAKAIVLPIVAIINEERKTKGYAAFTLSSPYLNALYNLETLQSYCTDIKFRLDSPDVQPLPNSGQTWISVNFRDPEIYHEPVSPGTKYIVTVEANQNRLALVDDVVLSDPKAGFGKKLARALTP